MLLALLFLVLIVGAVFAFVGAFRLERPELNLVGVMLTVLGLAVFAWAMLEPLLENARLALVR